MANSSDKSFRDFIRLEIVRDSILPEDRNKLSQEDLTITFSELPSDVNIQKSATYTDEDIPGRSEPWKVYHSSASTSIDFSAKLVAMGDSKSPNLVKTAVSTGGQLGNKLGLGGVLGTASTYAPRVYRNLFDLLGDKRNDDISGTIFEDVIKKAAVLESLVYPQYNNDGIAFPPPHVILRYGPLVRRGIVRDIRQTLQGPWDVQSGLPMVIEVSVTMEEVNRIPKGHMDVRNFKLPDNGAAGQPTSSVPFKSSILSSVRSTFGL